MFDLICAMARQTLPSGDPALARLDAWLAKRLKRKAEEARKPKPLADFMPCDRCVELKRRNATRRVYQMPEPDGRKLCMVCRKETNDERGWT